MSKNERKAETSKKRIEKIKNGLFENELEEYIQDIFKRTGGKVAKTPLMDEVVGVCSECMAFLSKQRQLRNFHFGYPANMPELSAVTKKLRALEESGFLSNNCGESNESSSYLMDSKSVEKKILRLFADKFGLGGRHWGYITSGGTESNVAGIGLAFEKYPHAILYYREDSHYSITKYAKRFFCQAIEHEKNGGDCINVSALLDAVLKNFRALGLPANIVLTFGSSMYGSCDDIARIHYELTRLTIPHYIHVDAAMFGGIPNNQINAPLITSLSSCGIDSITVSFHKYIGYPLVKGIILASRKPGGRVINHLGLRDTSILGSRDIMPYSMYWHTRELFTLSDPNDYNRNVKYFEQSLLQKGIPFYRAQKSNVFVVDAPPHAVVLKFQLACFDEQNTKKARIIIFPYHKQESMDALSLALMR